MKKSRILTIIALVLVAMLSFTACDAIKDLINPPTPDVQSHVCESVCPECGHCLDAECTDAACATKCQGHKTPDETPAHECESVCAECGKCTDADCTESACAEKCEGHEVAPAHKCESVCEECGKCTDADCSESVCAEKCEGHVAATTPVISVAPAELEINAGDDIDLMFGVTVSDEGDESPKLIIEDDEGFDANVEGVYTITYLAMNKFGVQATATRKVTVKKALSALTLEVQANRLGETKWQGTLLNFKNAEYVELNDSKTYDHAVSGVFHNNTSSEITLSIGGGYGVAGIITANGVVIEGRDGANARLMNKNNPDRAASTATIKADEFAKDMVIPAGGYAIVVQNGYCGTTVDSDGRGYMNYNVIWSYGNVVRLLWADTAEVLTPYVDQAPVISGYNTTIIAGTSDFVLETGVLTGVTATDDNGTFDPSDNVTVTIAIKDNGGFDINKPGKYTITLEATDGVNTTTVTRTVEVNTSAVEVKVGANGYTLLDDQIAIDQDLTVLGKYLFIVYTPDYKGALNWTNGWGEAFILNQYGEVIRIYDGANGKYYDLDNKGGIVDASKCTAAGYLTEAFNSRGEGEYLIVAPNGNGNLTRAFLLSNRVIGAKVVIPGITFKAHECESKCAKCGGCLDADCAEAACVTKCSCHKCESVCDICGKCTDATCTEEVCASKCEGHDVPAHACEHVCEHCAKCTDTACTEEVCASKCQGHDKSKFITVNGKKFEAVDGKWVYNTAVTTANAAGYSMIIFDKNFDGEFTTNGYGAAIVLDQYGTLVKVYDGANLGFYQGNGKETAHFTTANYATVAFSDLKDGETLIIFPNDGGSNAARGFALGLRTDGSIGKTATLTGFTFKSLNKTITINGKTFTAENGKWVYNTAVTTANAAGYSMIIFDKNFEGEFTTNGYGAAIVLNKYGVLVKVYDGANLGFYQGNGKETAHFTTANYATVAFSELQDGETLIIFPNDGGSNAARGFALGLRTDGSIGQTATLSDVEFEVYVPDNKVITINGKEFTALEGKWVYNTAVTTANAAGYSMIIFDKNFEGEFTTNGYGAAIVLNKYGVLVKVYDGANLGFYQGNGKETAHFNTGNYATVAFSDLQDGETLIIFPNDGGSNAARGFALGLRTDGSIGKVATFTGIEFESLTKTLAINGKSFTAENGKWVYNTAVTTANAAGYSMIIFDKNFDGEFTTNAYGAAIVLDANGNLIKVYDGANLGFYQGNGKETAHFTTANYATVAFSELQDGETLIIFPNDGGSNAARGFALGLRTDGSIGKTATLTGFTFN